MHLQVILIGSSNWGAFEGDLGDVHWIPSKCGTFGEHLSMSISFLSSMECFGGDLGVVKRIPSKWGFF